ncbi:MAG: hypothetical protein IJT43_11700 [Stomatobaculum sp.]|nr:hypothetical protein [Stomatobaculum sp.]
MKRFMVIAAAAAMSVMMAVPAFAKSEIARDSNGNGITIYYDDGSVFEYNARGSHATYYDSDGTVQEYDDVQLTEADFNRSSSSSSKKKSSSKSSKYEDAGITDAYWDYSSGKCTARWNAEYRSKGKYTITLYRDGHKVTSKSSDGGSSVNFTEAIANHNKTGDYYFTVKGKWSGGVTDSEDSDNLSVNSNRLATIRSRANGSSGGSSSGSANPSGGPGGVNSGWQWVNNTWKYLRPNGTYATNCWEQVNGKWYCFDGNGVMRSNQWIRHTNNEHIWYYVGSDGAMLTNTNVDGWSINAYGECYY